MAVFWCAGMYASGSTWAYNVLRAIAAPGGPVRARFANTAADLADIDDPSVTHVVKTHDLPPDAAAVLLAATPRIVATIRDPRDAVTSLMLYQRYPFDLACRTIAASARFVAAVAERPGTLLLRYDDGFTENPETVGRIAAALGVTLDNAGEIHARHNRAAVERFIAADLPSLARAQHDPRSGDVFDPETQWHKHHAGRTGEIGRWRRTLLPGQAAAIDAELGDWLDRFGYERTPLFPMGYSVILSGTPNG